VLEMSVFVPEMYFNIQLVYIKYLFFTSKHKKLYVVEQIVIHNRSIRRDTVSSLTFFPYLFIS
jgi:hypothetical protein